MLYGKLSYCPLFQGLNADHREWQCWGGARGATGVASFSLFLLRPGFKFLHSAASRHSSCNSSCHESSILVVRKPAFFVRGGAVFPPSSPGIYAMLVARPPDVWAEFLFESEKTEPSIPDQEKHLLPAGPSACP